LCGKNDGRILFNRDFGHRLEGTELKYHGMPRDDVGRLAEFHRGLVFPFCSAEPVIGYLKNEHRMERNYLHHRQGDANNAILAAVGYNFRLLIKWPRILLCLVLAAILAPPKSTRA
jgi:hypothetical protein